MADTISIEWIQIVYSLLVTIIYIKFIKYIEITETMPIDEYLRRVRGIWIVYTIIVVGFLIYTADIEFTTETLGIYIFIIAILTIIIGSPFIISYAGLMFVKEAFFTDTEHNKKKMKLTEKLRFAITYPAIGYMIFGTIILSISLYSLFEFSNKEGDVSLIYHLSIIFMLVLAIIPYIELYIHGKKIEKSKEATENARMGRV